MLNTDLEQAANVTNAHLQIATFRIHIHVCSYQVTYEERIYCLKLWTLEERRNRQGIIEVFKMCNGLSRLKLNELCTLADNTRGIRGHSGKLVKFRCTWDCCKYFFKQSD